MGILKLTGLILLTALCCSSCSSYRQNIMFKVPKGYTIPGEVQKAESNYVIRKNDLLELEVYTNKGERILDQNLTTLQPSSSSTEMTIVTYLVREDGFARFPLIEEMKVDGIKLHQAQEILQNEYKKYYQEPFVVLKYSNKRVTVLGAPGGVVVPLTNENMRLTEILALAKGTNSDFKAQNIRLLRGDTVLVADFSTIDGYLKSNFIVHPNDIIYIEPVRRPGLEAFKDYSSVFSLLATVTSIVVLFISLNQQ